MSDGEFFSSEGKDVPDRLSGFDTDAEIYGSDQNFEGSAASIESAMSLDFAPGIEEEIEERAREIQTRNNDPDIPDRFEDDVYRSEERAEAALGAVFRRGLGAYSDSAAKGVDRVQWGFARTADFADIVKSGEPDDPDFTQDNDLLPDGHPKAKRNGEMPFVEGVPSGEERDDIDAFLRGDG
jgi:hypothetical protein